MNIVYITILLHAVSETIPSRLDFLKSKLNNKKGWPQPAILLRSCVTAVAFVAWSIRVGHGGSKNCAKSDEKCFIMVCKKISHCAQFVKKCKKSEVCGRNSTHTSNERGVAILF